MMMTPGTSGPSSTHPEMLEDRFAAAASVLARWRYVLLAIVALAQAGVLVYMVADREALLANGRVVDLRVVPVDPRDLFRGDFVTLSYDISRVPRVFIDGELRRGEQILVRLAERQGNWQAVAAGRTRAEAGRVGEGEIVLKARVRYAPPSTPPPNASMISVSYGIEKFFVPEGAGRDIEKDVRANEVVAHVAVAADGTAALKGLTVAGTRYDMPPLF